MSRALTELDAYEAMETTQRMGMPKIQEGSVNVQDGVVCLYLRHLMLCETEIYD